MLVTSIFSFSHNVFYPIKDRNHYLSFLPFPNQTSILHLHVFCCLQMLSIWASLNLCRLVELTCLRTSPTHDSVCFNHFPNNPWFLRVCCTSLLKTQWKKERSLIMISFSFSHSVFYPFVELSTISSYFKLSSAYSVSLEESKICRLRKG